MAAEKLRAFWHARQGLGGSLIGCSPADVLHKIGWARSVGGANPYLTVRARTAIAREQMDADAACLKIHELPSARGCTYVLPAEDFALGLKLSQPASEVPISSAKKFLGVTEEEVQSLCDAIASALAGKAMLPAEIKDAVGDKVRSLGEEGKKRGQTTTLSLGLGRLQSRGIIRRVPVGGRLDQQRYTYTLWEGFEPDPRSSEEANSALAARYWRWLGLASLKHFQWFSGLSQTACRAATEPLGLQPIFGDLLIRPEDRDAWEAFEVPDAPSIACITNLDSLFLLVRNAELFLSEESRAAYQASGLAGSGLADLETNVIVDRGLVVGLWEYDPFESRAAWASFGPPSAEVKAAVAELEAWIGAELGDARSFSLDSPESRRPKLEKLRAMAGSVRLDQSPGRKAAAQYHR